MKIFILLLLHLIINYKYFRKSGIFNSSTNIADLQDDNEDDEHHQEPPILKVEDCSSNNRSKTLWTGQGIALQYEDNKWSTMGDKTLHNIKIFHSSITNQHTIMSDAVTGLILIDRYHYTTKLDTINSWVILQLSNFRISDKLKIKNSTDTSVSISYNDKLIGIKFQNTNIRNEFSSTVSEIIRLVFKNYHANWMSRFENF